MTFKSVTERLSGISKQGRFNSLLRILLIAVIVLAAGIIVHFYRDSHHAPFVATASNFEVVFPGTPTINTIPTQSNGLGSESGVLYRVPSGNDDYAVYVVTFSASASNLTPSKRRTAVEGDVSQLAKTDQATLSDGTAITFAGQPAVSATITPTGQYYNITTHIIAFLNGKNLYFLMGSGLSQSKFNSFTGSFHLLK